MADSFDDPYITFRKDFIEIVGPKALKEYIEELKVLVEERDEILMSYIRMKSLLQRFHEWYVHIAEKLTFTEPRDVMEMLELYDDCHCPWSKAETLVLHALAIKLVGESYGLLAPNWMPYVAYDTHENLLSRLYQCRLKLNEGIIAKICFTLFDKQFRCDAGSYTLLVPATFTVGEMMHKLSIHTNIPKDFLFLVPKRLWKNTENNLVKEYIEVPNYSLKVKFSISVPHYCKDPTLMCIHYLSST